MIRTRISVPKVCVHTAKLADEVISRLTRNQRAHRLTLALRDYTMPGLPSQSIALIADAS